MNAGDVITYEDSAQGLYLAPDLIWLFRTSMRTAYGDWAYGYLSSRIENIRRVCASDSTLLKESLDNTGYTSQETRDEAKEMILKYLNVPAVILQMPTGIKTVQEKKCCVYK